MSEENKRREQDMEPEEQLDLPESAEDMEPVEDTGPEKKKRKFSLYGFIFKKPPFIRRFRKTKFFKTLQAIWAPVSIGLRVAAGALCTVLLIVTVCCFIFAGILGDYLESDILPDAAVVLDDYSMDEPSFVYAVNDNGEIVRLQELYASTDWKKAAYEDIPEALIHAAIAIEDKRFYEHQGVDWITTIKAFGNMFFGSETVGGSSITQQLIKNTTGKDSVTVQRKVQEFFSATILERNNDKSVIMEEYLNTIYMGQGCRGVRSAAAAYFGKELQMLTIAECASLISITNNPSLFDPYSDEVFMYEGEERDGMGRNRYRQELVLGELLAQEYITQEEYDEAMAQKLVLKSSIAEEDQWLECEACTYEGIRKTYDKEGVLACPQCGTAPEIEEDVSQEVYSYFVDAVLKDVARDLALKDGVTEWNKDIWEIYLDRINRSGYHIYTTMDPSVQAQVDLVYKDLENIPKTKSAQQLQSAIVVVDNRTGDIVAMAGGVGDDKVHFGFNRATQSELQSGSSIKPLTIYAPAFELAQSEDKDMQKKAISPATVIKDIPLSYDDGPWPNNDNYTYKKSRTILYGVINSVNTIAAYTLDRITPEYGFNFAQEKFGISTLVEEDMQFASLALGAQYNGVTVRDMSCAFATFANNGTYREGRTYLKVYDSDGNVVLDNEQEVKKDVLSEKTVNYMNYCLTEAVNQGTGYEAKIKGISVAGKTGSTSSFRDRWFCGFTGYYTAALWCGYDIPERIYPVNGGNPAAQLWNDVMEPLHEGKEDILLYDKRVMKSVAICKDSGKIATDACRQDIRTTSSDKDTNRVDSVMVYPEDIPSGKCTLHTMVEICKSGDGVATEYCKQFATVDTTMTFEEKGLLKLTATEVKELLRAKSTGALQSMYTRDDYVYLVDKDGKDADFTGFDGKINKDVKAPYKVCTKHTQKTWEEYQQTLPPETEEDPDDDTNSGGNIFDRWF